METTAAESRRQSAAITASFGGRPLLWLVEDLQVQFEVDLSALHLVQRQPFDDGPAVPLVVAVYVRHAQLGTTQELCQPEQRSSRPEKAQQDEREGGREEGNRTGWRQ